VDIGPHIKENDHNRINHF